ncbi:MAG: iron-sulfur cluster assembly scaffold protein [Erythrobacter sp.]
MRSRTCGSSIKLGLDFSDEGGAGAIGMQVTACAVGQSSASIMAAEIGGKSLEELASIASEIEAWQRGAGSLPQWPKLDLLESVQTYPGRHEAMMLPWKAAIEALSSGASAS